MPQDPLDHLDHPEAYLEIKNYLLAQVLPVANQIDADSSLLFQAFRDMGSKGWLVPKAPTSLGGLGFDTEGYGQFQRLMARHSGALAFLQTQHQSAASLLLASENEALKQAYIPAMAKGKKRVGVGFSQLRRQPPPLLAKRVAGGYALSGEVPWVSGAGLFEEFVGAAVLPSGEAVFGLLPLVSGQLKLIAQPSGPAQSGSAQSSSAQSGRLTVGELTVGEPMALCAMAATNTVQVKLQDWFLPDEQVVGQRPAGWIAGRDHANPLSPLPLMFGCTQASLDVLMRSLTRRHIDHDIVQKLGSRLEGLIAAQAEAVNLPISAYSKKIALRGKAISLMNTSAQAAIISASGAANALSHPAQRVYREALLFSVSGQTTEGAIASLDCLC
ncbi:MAG: acyl-CoA dehydrogenase family protein [Cyanobacteria bacterium P01_F01_bin.53]